MTKEQVVQLLGEIKGIYGNKFELNEHTPTMWYKHLASMDFEMVSKRIDRYVENEKFPPTISDLKNPIIYNNAPTEYKHDENDPIYQQIKAMNADV